MNVRNPLTLTALILAIIGALNWGLVGLFDFNLVDELFGEDSFLTNLIYILVGLSGLYLAVRAAMGATETEHDHPVTT